LGNSQCSSRPPTRSVKNGKEIGKKGLSSRFVKRGEKRDAEEENEKR